MTRCLLLLTASLCGCGYSTDSLYRESVTRVAVTIFDNTTLRPGHEFAMTEAVIREIQARTPYTIVPEKDADFVLRGNLLEYALPALIEGQADTLILSAVSLTVHVRIEDSRKGEVVFEGNLAESADLVEARGDSETSALAEVRERIARRIVALLERPWEAPVD